MHVSKSKDNIIESTQTVGNGAPARQTMQVPDWQRAVDAAKCEQSMTHLLLCRAAGVALSFKGTPCFQQHHCFLLGIWL